MKKFFKNKFIKIFVVNIVIFLFLFLLIDIITYYKRIYVAGYDENLFKSASYINRISMRLNEKEAEKYIFEKADYRPVENIDSYYNPIVLLGCSFAYGAGLEDNQTFSYYLGKITKRPVYNRANGGWGVQHALFQLSSDKFYNIVSNREVSPPPEYIIYTYMGDHVKRIHLANEPIIFGGLPIFVYQRKHNNSLVFSNFSNIFFHFPVLSFIKQGFFTKFEKTKNRAEFLKLHFISCKKEIDKHLKDTVFVILIFEYNSEIMSIINDLRDEGILVVSVEDLTGTRDYDTLSDDDMHPSSKAWETITPKLFDWLNKAIKDNSVIEKQKEVDAKKLVEFHEYNYTIDDFAAENSICYYDRKLINKKEIKPLTANIAYAAFSISYFLESIKLNRLANFFRKVTIKLNPKNKIYIQQINNNIF